MNTCSICYNDETDDDIKCNRCKNKLCLKCLVNIHNDEELETDDNTIEYMYKCPYCREQITINFNRLEQVNKGIFKKLYAFNFEKFVNNQNKYNEMYKKIEDYRKIIENLQNETFEINEKYTNILKKCNKGNEKNDLLLKLVKDQHDKGKKSIKIHEITKIYKE